jgi:uncharacterized protein involved in high-affinity Fe2+ transport
MMDPLVDAIQGLLNLLDMIGAGVRRALGRSDVHLNEEIRTRDNTLVGVGTLAVMGVLCLFLFAC